MQVYPSGWIGFTTSPSKASGRGTGSSYNTCRERARTAECDHQRDSRGGVGRHRALDNPAEQVKFMSNQVQEVLGYTVEQWMTAPGLWALIVHPDDRSRFVQDAIEIFGSDRGSGSHEYRCLTKDGRTVRLESHASVVACPLSPTNEPDSLSRHPGLPIPATAREWTRRDLRQPEIEDFERVRRP